GVRCAVALSEDARLYHHVFGPQREALSHPGLLFEGDLAPNFSIFAAFLAALLGSALSCRTTVMQSVPRAVATGSPPIARIEIARICYPVATALGTDLILKLGHYQVLATLCAFA